jgi:signal transduction histidine kinase/CheY-like chemotaxis protein
MRHLYWIKSSIALVFLWLPSIPLSAQAADVEGQLLPSYRNRFYQEEASFAEKCFNKAVRDERGRVWLDACGVHRIINAIGFFQFDGYEYQPFQPYHPDDHTPIRFPNIIGLTKSGQLLCGADGLNLFLLDPDTRAITMVEKPAYGKNLVMKGAYQQADEYFLLLSNNEGNYTAIWVLEGSSMRVVWEDKGAFKTRWANNGFHTLWVNDDEFWLMGSWFPLLRIDRSSGVVREYNLDALDVPDNLQEVERYQEGLKFRMERAPDGNLYLSLPAPKRGQNYFLRYDPVTDRFVRTEQSFPDGWKHETLFQDKKGNLCLLFRGPDQRYRALLWMVDGQRWDYSSVVDVFSNIRQLSSDDFTREVLVLDNGELNNVGVRRATAIRSMMPGKWISSMASLPGGDLLVNTVNEGWFQANPQSGDYSRFAGPLCSGSGNPFSRGMRQQLISDEEGGLWFCADDLLSRYDPGENTCEAFRLPQRMQLFCLLPNDLVALQYNRSFLSFYDLKNKEVVDRSGIVPNDLQGTVRDLFLDSREWFWVVTNDGLWCMDWKNSIARRYTQADGFAENRFTTIFEDTQGRIWLGTYSGGLHIFDPQSGAITIIDEKNGLSNNAVMSIIADEEGMVWVATEYGITLMTETGEVITGIYEEEGLSTDVFERFDPYRGPQGRLFFGSSQGITIIDPRQFKATLQQSGNAGIYLTEIRYYDRAADKEVSRQSGLQNLSPIHIPPDNPYFHLKFSLSTLLEPQKHRYAYRFSGLSDKWIELGRQSELNIDRLPPGRYDLEITGADFRNRSPEDALRIPLVVHDFFYRQPWFYVLAAMPFLAFALVWGRNKQLENRRLEAEVDRRTEEIRSDRDLIEAQAQELQQVDEMKTRFFSNISHELRTPVTLISAPVEELLAQNPKGKNNQVLQLVLRNARKLRNLVEELLELSRVDASRVNLNEEATALTPFCFDLFTAYQPAATTKAIQYIYESSLTETASFWVDRNRLEKIINNLLSNALKFTPRNGLVKCTLALEGDRLHFAVRDTGRGIPVEDLPHVFDRYFQTNRKDISVEGGTGIGLSLSKELAKLMQGELTVESEWTQGSCFHLWLPARPATAEVTTAKIEPQIKWSQEALKDLPAKQATATNLPRVLIVEDNPDMQELLVSLLSGAYQCQVAQHGAEAWQWLSEKKAEVAELDLIISDIMMPEMDGYELLERIKQDIHWKQLPVIMLTARTAEEDKLQALRMGVDDYLMKPFSPEELRIRAANLIGNYKERQALQQTKKEVPSAINVDFAPVDDVDLTWLKKVEEAAKEALDKGLKLNTAYLANMVFLSERQFARHLKVLTGLTPNQYLQEIKLQKARYLLENNACQTVGEVASLTGFSSGSYLTKLYKAHFGKSPSEYLKADS